MVLKKKTTHTQKTIFLPSKCNFKFQRQDLGQWFGSFFILPKLGHHPLLCNPEESESCQVIKIQQNKIK